MNIKIEKTDRLIEALEKWADQMELAEKELIAILDQDLGAGWYERSLAEQKTQANLLKRTASLKPSKQTNVQPENDVMPSSNLVETDVIEVLREAHCVGNNLYLPPAQLERNLYERVNEVLLLRWRVCYFGMIAAPQVCAR